MRKSENQSVVAGCKMQRERYRDGAALLALVTVGLLCSCRTARTPVGFVDERREDTGSALAAEIAAESKPGTPSKTAKSKRSSSSSKKRTAAVASVRREANPEIVALREKLAAALKEKAAREKPSTSKRPETRPPDRPVVQPGHVVYVIVVVDGRTHIEELGKRVSSTGHITLPLVGLVKVKGLTTGQMSVRLKEKFSVYIKSPTVDSGFAVDSSPGAISPWGYVTVLGEVRAPGRISIPPTQDLNLSMAIQLAGGLDRSAKDTAIRVTRRDASDELKSRTINLRAAASKGKVKNDISLKAGDIIFVPQKVF